MATLASIIPPALKPLVKRLVPDVVEVARIRRVWRGPDRERWPPPMSVGDTGIERYGYSMFSQNCEDGIIRHLFSEIGFRSRLFVEFGFGLTENNTLRLVLREAFGGLYIDASQTSVRRFNRAAREAGMTHVRAVAAFLSTENVRTVLADAGVRDEIDLLSIDVDGNDYWLWNALDGISPRVVVIEYNASLGPDLSLSVPYDPAFDRHEKHASGFYCGASLKAMWKLARRKGYSLVGCESSGVNAFFVRDDCVTDTLVVLTPEVAYRQHRGRLAGGMTTKEQFSVIEHMPFVEV